ncbi:nitroreductase family protein [uncultured Tolumonas sp.]|uniref:nitroreductase family protein n=1 Tax=uncultured Tolumonas sp. TaxID=263765 RepID=UPI002930913A|nr:nitroreductase family protein [uncultured Tolumonas sp.]
MDIKVNTVSLGHDLNVVTKFLLSRHSSHHLALPAPDEKQLNIILRAAMRAPDFQYMRPFRFLVAKGDGLIRLGELFAQSAKVMNKPEQVIERVRKMPLRAPVVITVVATPAVNKHVSAFDQILCASSSVLMMQMAAQSLGFNGIWRSGWLMQSRELHQLFELQDTDQIVGFLYLGTPTESVAAVRPDDSPEPYTQWL